MAGDSFGCIGNGSRRNAGAKTQGSRSIDTVDPAGAVDVFHISDWQNLILHILG
jgi:hypothetical protein